MKWYQHLFKRFLGASWNWVFVLGISVGVLGGCGSEGMNFASADPNPQGELLSDPQGGGLSYESASNEFLFVPKNSSEMDFSSVDSYARGTLDANVDLLEDFDAIPLDSTGSFKFEFVPDEGGTRYLSVRTISSAVPGTGMCCYTFCSSFGTCGNWLTGYYGCCLSYGTTCASCQV